MLRRFLFLVMLLLPEAMLAQGDVEYRMEIGAGLGIMTYEGDFNGSIFKVGQPMASVMLRRIINPYHGFRANLGIGTLKGSSKNDDSYYPGMQETPHEFKNTAIDLSATYEYNFWPYGTGRDYRGAKRLTPFIAMGLGFTFAKAKPENVFTANLPLGMGVKYKLADRLNLGVEWMVHFTLSDKLDGSPDPYSIRSSGLFKNTDCYSALQVSVTYSFMAKCRTCHNEDE